jgi:D-inositol-3-phosphate glycosyltransferase
VCVGTWRPGTGFTRVLEAIGRGLSDTFDVHWAGIGYAGPLTVRSGVTLHPTNERGGDVFAAAGAASLVADLDAPIVLILYDLWMLHVYGRTLPQLPRPPAVVAYVPLDGEIVDASRLLGPLGFVDRFVAYTRFGQERIERSIRELVDAGADFTASRVEVIPHGIDRATFFPLPGGRAEARQQLFADDPEWRDAFIVLNANRPMERKRIDLTLDGFARFTRDKASGVKLWLHHAVMDAEEHARVQALVEGFGLTDRVRLSSPADGPVSDEDLNLVYNACDVGINTALGEGWGLVSFEHAATGAAQVVPDNSACTELWAGAAELIETSDTGVPGFTALAMRMPDADGVAAALERLCADETHLQEMSAAAYRNATQPRYSWDAIADQWRAVLANVIAVRAGR